MSEWVVELNADVAEGAPYDDQLLKLVQRANVCLGVHAGTPELTHQTVEKCRSIGVKVCAHPGYPDRTYYGRRSLAATGLAVEEVRESLVDQLESWQGLDSLKPHGGFYNDSQEHGLAFDLLVEIMTSTRMPLVGMPRTAHTEAADLAKVPFIAEGFADRAYTPTGRLVPRSQPGAYIGVHQVPEQMESLRGTVRSICVHGDGDDPVARLSTLTDWLKANGIEVRAWTP